jgi:hypothetical protein
MNENNLSVPLLSALVISYEFMIIENNNSNQNENEEKRIIVEKNNKKKLTLYLCINENLGPHVIQRNKQHLNSLITITTTSNNNHHNVPEHLYLEDYTEKSRRALLKTENNYYLQR